MVYIQIYILLLSINKAIEFISRTSLVCLRNDLNHFFTNMNALSMSYLTIRINRFNLDW